MFHSKSVMTDVDAAEVKAAAGPDMKADEAAEVEAAACRTFHRSLVQLCHLRWIAVLQRLPLFLSFKYSRESSKEKNMEIWFEVGRMVFFLSHLSKTYLY